MTLVKIDGRDVDVLNNACEYRPCFWLGFDKGSFTQGVGYTSYHRGGPRAVCMTRHLHGCPHVGFHVVCGDCHAVVGGPYATDDHVVLRRCECGSTDTYKLLDVLPDPTPCCDNIDLADTRGRVVYRQRCRSCGTWLRGLRLELAQAAAR